MSIFTVYCLFMSDIQAACIRIEFDYASNVIQCILLAIFAIEWILNIIAKKDYIWSFFFLVRFNINYFFNSGYRLDNESFVRL